MTETSRAFAGLARINGAQLYYEIAGQGRPMLLLHGGLADSRMWDDQFNVFARRYRVIRLDLRGFGRSTPAEGPYALHDDLHDLLQELRAAPAIVVGVSFGGEVAIDLALAYPETVMALILVSSALGGTQFTEETMARLSAADDAAEAGDLPLAVELENQLWIDGRDRAPEEIAAGVRERTRVMNLSNWNIDNEKGEPEKLDPPAAERLGEIRIPTLIITGDRDVPDILTIADTLQRGISEAESVVIPDTAHHLTMEKPAEFNRLVLDWLDRRRRR